MADPQSSSEKECLLRTQYTTCIGVRIFMAQMLDRSGQRDGKVLSSPTSNGVTYHSTEVRDFVSAVSHFRWTPGSEQRLIVGY